MATDIVIDDADRLAQVKDSAGAAKHELFQALAVIHAAFDLAEDGGTLNDVTGNLTSSDSRLQSLLIMARDKTAAALNNLDFV